MNSITETTIFDYMEIEILGDLERLQLCLDNVEDDELCLALETTRKNGRDDFPVRVMLNLTYAMKVFGHRGVASLRRELSRNPSLRKMCGLKDEDYLYLGKRKSLVPEARVFTNFFKNLVNHQELLDKIMADNVMYMYENLEDFGEDCAYDGKILETYAKKNGKGDNDLRKEHEATHTCKSYQLKNGTKKKTWYFGYRDHILCCAKYGLPIWHKLETASINEQTVLDDMIEELSINKKYILEKMNNLIADAGYDNGKRNVELKEEYNINPIIDTRHLWKEEEFREVENKPLAYPEFSE